MKDRRGDKKDCIVNIYINYKLNHIPYVEHFKMPKSDSSPELLHAKNKENKLAALSHM